MCTTIKTPTISEIRKMAIEQMNTTFTYRGREFNMVELGWSFRFGTKRRSLGTCRISRKTIELSQWVISNCKNDMETWVNTMLHEIAHAIDVEIRGRSAHDWQWRSIALAIGCDGERCGSVKYVENVKSKYTIKCPKCNYQYPGHKRSKVVEQGRRSCGKCYPYGYNEDYALIQLQNY